MNKNISHSAHKKCMQTGKVPATRVIGGWDESPFRVSEAHRNILGVRFVPILAVPGPHRQRPLFENLSN